METRITINADMNDILFDGKNKSYGAFAIRKEYGKTILNSFYAAVIGMLTIVLFFYGSFEPPKAKEMLLVDTLIVIPTIPEKKILPIDDKKDQTQKPKDDLQTKVDKPIETTIFVVPVPSDSVPDSVSPHPNDSIKGAIGSTDKKGCIGCPPPGDPNGCDTCGGTGTTVKKDTALSPIMVDVSADIPNLKDIKDCIEFPPMMKEIGQGGNVYLRVIIGADGSIEDIQVYKSTHILFTKAVQKCAGKMKGKAGVKDGQAVKSWVIVPFKFQLNK